MTKKNRLHLGDEVEVISDAGTKRKRGTITINDSKTMDYKINFDDKWCGYYNRKDLKVVKQTIVAEELKKKENPMIKYLQEKISRLRIRRDRIDMSKDATKILKHMELSGEIKALTNLIKDIKDGKCEEDVDGKN